MKHLIIDKVNFKGVKFNLNEHKDQLKKGIIIKYYYGIQNLIPCIGKVNRIFDKGVEVYTDGFYMVPWNKITKIWIPKEQFKYSPTRLNVEKHYSMLPYLDGVFNSLKIRYEHKHNFEIDDKCVDLTTRFYRILKIKNILTKKYIQLSIDNIHEYIVIDENKNEYKLKFDENSFKKKINKLVNIIENLFNENNEHKENKENKKVNNFKKEKDKRKKENGICNKIIELIKIHKNIKHSELLNELKKLFSDKKELTINNTINNIVWRHKDKIIKEKNNNDIIYTFK